MFFVLAATVFAQPKLTVTAATGKQVDLEWSGADGPAAVERRTAGGKYEPIATVKDRRTYSDSSIDAMTIYQYRVRSDAANGGKSNELTVGPPATGYTIAQAPPQSFVTNSAQTNFAASDFMELDANGDPAFVYTVVDPELKAVHDADLMFLHWDRVNWRWKQPVKIVSFLPYRNGASLAHDPQSSTWATVIEEDGHLRLFVSSDDGATWKQKHELKNESGILGRAVALSGGRVYWGYNIEADGAYLLSGDLAAGPSSWKMEKLPLPEPYQRGAPDSSLAVAVDSQGKPGMTYFGYGPDYNVTALYWRPGMSSPLKVQDSDGVQNDTHEAMITFSGSPRDQAKFLVELNRKKTGDVDPQMWVGWDKGGQIALAPPIPTDGGHHSLNAPFSISFGANGQGAALIYRNSGTGDDRCGSPKLARGGSSGAWTTCSPDPKRDVEAGSFGWGMSVRHAVNNKLYAGFSTGSGPLGPGLILWREP